MVQPRVDKTFGWLKQHAMEVIMESHRGNSVASNIVKITRAINGRFDPAGFIILEELIEQYKDEKGYNDTTTGAQPDQGDHG